MTPLSEALAWLAARTPRRAAESVPLHQAAGRILAEDLALDRLPSQAVAAMDGWAVWAADTEGASDYAPMPLAGQPVRAGDAMPPGTDAVLALAQVDGASVLLAVPPGHGVLAAGHHAGHGQVLAAGTKLGPLHLALLGGPVSCVGRARVGGAVSPMLHALVGAQGGVVDLDSPDLILQPVSFDADAIRGVAIRPGETSAIGLVGGVPGLALPSDPLACAIAFTLLAAPALRRLGGRAEPGSVPARLTRKIASGLGQIDAVPVLLKGGEATPLGPAEGGSLHACLVANGLVLAPEGSEGYAAGTMVAVHPFP